MATTSKKASAKPASAPSAQADKPAAVAMLDEVSTDLQVGASYDPGVYGQTGLRQLGGFVMEEWNPALKGEQGRRIYTQMGDNDPIVGGVLYAFTALFRSVEWHVEAAKADPQKDAKIKKRFGGIPSANPDATAIKPPGTPSDPALGFNDPATSNMPEEDQGVAPPTPEEEAATFLEEVLDDMEQSWDAHAEEVASMFQFGFAPCEILYKKRIGPDETDPVRHSKYTDGKIGLRGVPLRSQNTVYRWEIDADTGTILGMWQQPWAGQQVFIPMAKMALFRTTAAKNNPEGRSILRNAYRPWLMKTRLEEIEAIGAERDLAGLPIARIPARYMQADASNEEKAVFNMFKTMVQSVKRDKNEGLVLPSDLYNGTNEKQFDFELMGGGSTRQFDTTKIIERYEKGIATSVLADFMFLGQGATGSFALSADKTDLFAQALTGFLKAVAGIWNRVIIPAIWKLNKLDMDCMPKLVPGDVAKANLAEIATFLSSLSSSGAPLFPDHELENHLRKLAGLPPAPEEGSEERNKTQPAGAVPPGMEGAVGPDGKPVAPPFDPADYAE
jgi:hypothetical protein